MIRSGPCENSTYDPVQFYNYTLVKSTTNSFVLNTVIDIKEDLKGPLEVDYLRFTNGLRFKFYFICLLFVVSNGNHKMYHRLNYL